MKKLLLVNVILIGIFLIYLYAYETNKSGTSRWGQDETKRTRDETYVMVTFQSGMDYWKRALKGFEDSAKSLNVSIEYRGATQYDVNEETTILEQIIAKKPAGIALSAINPEALNKVINKAIEAKIPIVLFDSGAPESKAYSFLGTDNYYAGVTAAKKLGQLLHGKGQVGIITLPNQLNHQERIQGFKETILKEFPNMQVVEVGDGNGDQIISKEVALNMMKEFPNLAGIFATEANGGVGVGEAAIQMNQDKKLKIISFDTDKGTLDMIKEGTISATLAQGTWKMGYWALQLLFQYNHNINDEQKDVLFPRYVDTGITVVTRDNVENYYAR